MPLQHKVRNKSLSSARRLIACAAVLVASVSLTTQAQAQPAWETPNTGLTVTNNALPPQFSNGLYMSPMRVPDITASQIAGAAYYAPKSGTVVGQKVDGLQNELTSLQGLVVELSKRLEEEQEQSQVLTSEYFASIATIQTQLQSGTTPGNPRLIKRLAVARNNLESLSTNITAFNNLYLEVTNAASMASFLLDTARATFSLSGAIEEDHVSLSKVEDGISNVVIMIERLSSHVADDIARTTAYLNTERQNLEALSLAVSTGNMFGRSLTQTTFNRSGPVSPFNNQAAFTQTAYSGMQAARPMAAQMQAPRMMPPPMFGQQQPAMMRAPTQLSPTPTSFRAPMAAPMQAAPNFQTSTAPAARPLAKIRFDKANVAFEQPVYLAVSEALKRQPNSRFEVVAVHPNSGNAAQTAIESTKARRNAERVLRSLSQMGIGVDQVKMTYTPRGDVATNEVHLYVY